MKAIQAPATDGKLWLLTDKVPVLLPKAVLSVGDLTWPTTAMLNAKP